MSGCSCKKDDITFLAQTFLSERQTAKMSLSFYLHNRWVMVYFPHKSNTIFSRQNSKICIAICWILPLLVVWPSFFGLWGFNGLECVSRSCTIIRDSEGRSIKGFLLILGLTFPCCILIVTNVSIYVKVTVWRIISLLQCRLDGFYFCFCSAWERCSRHKQLQPNFLSDLKPENRGWQKWWV